MARPGPDLRPDLGPDLGLDLGLGLGTCMGAGLAYPNDLATLLARTLSPLFFHAGKTYGRPCPSYSSNQTIAQTIKMSASQKGFETDRHGWAELLADRNPAAALAGKHRPAWTVVGAGVTGLACARRLAELHPGEQIMLLEAREVGQGASGRNSGFAVAASHFPGPVKTNVLEENRRINRINRAGLSLLRQQVAENAISCQWSEQGFFHAAADTQSVHERDNFSRYLEALGIPHEILAGDELHHWLGTDHYRAGIRVHEGALVQPASLVRGLADSLPRNVTLLENSPVLSVTRGITSTLQLPGGMVETDRLILAVNFEAPMLGFLRGRIAASTLAGSFTRRLTPDELASLGALQEWGILSLHGGGATVRLTSDGRISLRNTAEYHGGKLLSDSVLAERGKIHRASFELRFPQLKHVPFEFAWSGTEGISRNQTNFFNRPDHNIWLAGGYNGSGVSRGTAFGHALAEYASGGQSDLISDCLASTPATWIPPSPLLDIGAAWTVRKRFAGVGRDR